jgi:hypothetical protein
MQAKRILFLIVMFGLPLIPTVGLASRQDSTPTIVECTEAELTGEFGKYLGQAEVVPIAEGEGVLELYRFTFSAMTQMPPEPNNLIYDERLVVLVEGDGFELTIYGGTATVVLPTNERVELDAGTQGYELEEGWFVLHPGGTDASYSYANVGEVEATLAVSVVDNLSSPPNYECSWCQVRALWMIVSGEASASSAKRIPSIMCKGG